ncbi:metallophosphoesterase [Halarcobacter ebronensis]|uniref:Metallophosphoesterase n=1 Tax=Halarcobacter ebronensis TaxID=1462615 RepID=A0A4Q1APK2_9BACT|nr:metallophosphoesterase [Halarcobacter ebronensis]RXK08272.1 metallophosphoesterase [Halarcobacter ebronensis]
MRFIIFATIFFIVMSLFSLYVSKRFVKKLHFSKKIKHLINTFLAINLLGVLAYMLARYNPSVPNWIYFLLSVPIGIIFLLFITTIFYDLLCVIVNRAPIDEKRRGFFKKSLDIGALSLATAVNAKAMYNARNYQVEEVDVKIKNLKKPYNIVQLSDIHIGGLIDKEFIASIVKRVNSLNADIVVITGDLVDTNIKYAQAALEELKNLKSTYGTYFIVGNHEYFHGVQSIIKYVNSLGIKTLENENIYIGEKNQGFYLAGVYDLMGNRVDAYKPDLKKALENIKEEPTILLAHQPKFIEEVKDSVDLVLSGHTHGGQIFPFNFLVKLQQPYIKGLHKYNVKTQIYVNKGTGFWGPPMRLGSSSEITLLKLT